MRKKKKREKKEDTGSPVQGNCTSKEVYVRVTYSHFAVQYNFNTFPNDAETFLSIIPNQSFSPRGIKRIIRSRCYHRIYKKKRKRKEIFSHRSKKHFSNLFSFPSFFPSPYSTSTSSILFLFPREIFIMFERRNDKQQRAIIVLIPRRWD